MAIQRYQSLDGLIAAAKSGVKVYWINDGYLVENWSNGLHVVFQPNRHAIGLTTVHGDLNGDLSQFYSYSPTVTNC